MLKTRYGEIIFIQAAMAATLALTALALRYSGGRDRAADRLDARAERRVVADAVVLGSREHDRRARVDADVLHVVAAALWTGGLAFLVIGLRLAEGDRWPLATRAVPRFSTMAVHSVVALIVAGFVAAYLQVRTWRGLWETEYGLLLLAKIVLAPPRYWRSAPTTTALRCLGSGRGSPPHSSGGASSR